MRLKLILPFIALTSLLSVQVEAAQSSRDRIGSPVTGGQQFTGRIGGGAVFVSLLGLTAFVLGILAAVRHGDRPNSP